MLKPGPHAFSTPWKMHLGLVGGFAGSMKASGVWPAETNRDSVELQNLKPGPNAFGSGKRICASSKASGARFGFGDWGQGHQQHQHSSNCSECVSKPGNQITAFSIRCSGVESKCVKQTLQNVFGLGRWLRELNNSFGSGTRCTCKTETALNAFF